MTKFMSTAIEQALLAKKDGQVLVAHDEGFDLQATNWSCCSGSRTE